MEDVESMTVQEHIEYESFYSEFDLPYRWGSVRLREFYELNFICFQLCYWFDFTGRFII
jgi:hypothetical protein